MAKNAEAHPRDKHHNNQDKVPPAPQHSLRLLMVIVEHGYAEEIVELLNDNGVFFEMVFQGRGTASSQLLGLLGLDGDQKDIIISIVEPDKAAVLFDKIYEEYRATGIALTVKLNSIGGSKTINLLKGDFLSHVNAK